MTFQLMQYIALGVQLLTMVGIFFLLRPLISGAVYFPTTEKNIQIIKKMADLKPGQKLVDLGSGDGRILIALAETGVAAIGYEIGPLLVLRSRRLIKKNKLQDKVKIYRKSFWGAYLSTYDVVVVYGFPHIMSRLQRKLKRELKPGTKIISNIYQFPDWKPIKEEDGVRLYIK